MKFSLSSSTIIGASLVLASPIEKRQDIVVGTIVAPATTVVPVTTVLDNNPPDATGGFEAVDITFDEFVVSQDSPSGTDSAPVPNVTVDVLEFAPVGSNSQSLNGTNFDTLFSNTDTNDADGSTVSYSSGASSPVSGSSNPNQIGGGPGNAGSILGSGTNSFGTDVYDYSGYPGGFDRQPGQSENGSYGPDSGPGEGAVTVQTAAAATATGVFSGAPAVSTSTFFRLVAETIGDARNSSAANDINGRYLGTYHVSAGSSIAHLTSPSGGTGGSSGGTGPGNGSGSGGTGRVFYTNGTAYEVSHREGTTVTSGGTSPFPESIVLTDGLASTNVGASNLGNIYINAGEGTKGVEIEQNDQGLYVLSGAGDAGYYACVNNNVPYNATTTLKYLQEDGEGVPSECTPIVLIPECADSDGNAYTTGEANAAQQNPTGCYISVEDLDLSGLL